jgi:prevent-host-death family protein
MATFANISEIRTQINPFIKQVQKGEQVILLKYGKPAAVLVDYKKLERLEQLEERFEKTEKARNSLNKISSYFEKNKTGEKWLQEKGLNRENLTDDEIIELVANA